MPLRPAPPIAWSGTGFSARRGRHLAGAASGRLATRLAVPLAVAVLWQVATSRGWMSPQVLPAPSQVAATFVELFLSGDIPDALLISLRRVALGFAAGALAGLPLGLLLGLSQRAEDYVGPLFRAFAAVPSLGWLPILILIFGIEEPLKILIIAKAAMVPLTLGTSRAIRGIPPRLVETARVLRLRPWTRLTRVLAPATVPTVFSGARLGLSHAFIALVVAEMLAATEGVGYMMTWGRTLFQIDIVIVGMILIGLIGFLLDLGLRRIEARLSRWNPARD